MMKSSATSGALCLMLLAATFVVAKELSVLVYPEMSCKGEPNITYSPVETCVPLPSEPGLNFSAFMYHWPRNRTMVQVFPFASKNCSEKGTSAFVPCDQCAYAPAVGYYRYDCDTMKEKVHIHMNCSKGCGSCTKHYVHSMGTCVQYGTIGNASSYIYIDSFLNMTVIPETLWGGTNGTCPHDSPDQETHDQPCSVCLGNVILGCLNWGPKPPAKVGREAFSGGLKALRHHRSGLRKGQQ